VGVDDYTMLGQVLIQAKGVLMTVVWSGVVSLVLFKLLDVTMGLRVSEEEERQGLDTASHGERAYSL
ncbi:MAG: ammonia channel protein, partial [Thiothrix sp.]